MDRKTVLAMMLCFGIWIVWDLFFFGPEREKQKLQLANRNKSEVLQKVESGGAEVAKGVSNTVGTVSTNNVLAAPSFEKKVFVLENNVMRVEVDNRAAAFSKIEIKGYFQDYPANRKLVDLALFDKQIRQNNLVYSGDDFNFINTCELNLVSSQPDNLVLACEQGAKKFRVNLALGPDSYVINSSYTFSSDETIKGSFDVKDFFNGNHLLKNDATNENLIHWANQAGVNKLSLKDEKIVEEVSGLEFITIGNKYFAYGLKNSGAFHPSPIYSVSGENAEVGFSYPLLKLAKRDVQLDLNMFLGPKKLEFVRKFDTRAEKIVDFGFFSFLAYPMLKLIIWLFELFNNFGVAIILSTLILRVLIFPITLKQIKSMKEMKKHEPAMAGLREKYKDNKEELNKQMMLFMRQNKVNPFSSCLPVLLQIPIFIAYYSVLGHSVELFHAPFFAWIGDLSNKDPFYVLPVLMTVTMFIQTKMVPQSPTMDPMQAKIMLYMMPAMMFMFMFNLPAGLTLYMFVNSILGILQNLLIYKKDPNNAMNALLMT